MYDRFVEREVPKFVEGQEVLWDGFETEVFKIMGVKEHTSKGLIYALTSMDDASLYVGAKQRDLKAV